MFYTDSETLPWPDWRGSTAVCIATGPSLTNDQVEAVRTASVRSIGINDIGLTHRWIDIWYAADFPFWKFYEPSAASSDALKVCADPDVLKGGIADRYLSVSDKDREKAKRYEPGFALHGEHSGFQALQLAISLGAERVILLGYDCKPEGQKTNYFGTKSQALYRHSHYETWPLHYDKLVIPAGVEVLNATAGSAIEAYPFVEIERALR